MYYFRAIIAEINMFGLKFVIFGAQFHFSEALVNCGVPAAKCRVTILPLSSPETQPRGIFFLRFPGFARSSSDTMYKVSLQTSQGTVCFPFQKDQSMNVVRGISDCLLIESCHTRKHSIWTICWSYLHNLYMKMVGTAKTRYKNV